MLLFRLKRKARIEWRYRVMAIRCSLTTESELAMMLEDGLVW
jgi:hypothetical protein